MSLKDKVIKNTLYYVISQLFGFIIPIILIPFIIAKIGTVQFGIYAILMGFIGAFGVLDLGVSTSFIKYITEYNIKNETDKLNKFINTGLIFYILFSLTIIIISFLFSEKFIELFNIDPELRALSVYAFKLSLVTFFFSNITTIFTCILFSTQNIHKTSLIGIALHILNFFSCIYLLEKGYGLAGLFYIQIGFSFSILVMNYLFARTSLSLRIGLIYFDLKMLKQMFGFGTQIQVSRIAVLLSEKFDEFLLGTFTNMVNVTYFNTASKVVRASRFFPLQLVPQMGTASSVYFARHDKSSIETLFSNFTRYMLLFSIPLFSIMFIFSDSIIFIWLGEGFGTSAYILKILAVGQFVYLVFSIPGNSILPSMGLPKYLMYEGLITLIFNVILTYILVKIYGVKGAAFGATISIIISSVFLFTKACRKLHHDNYRKLRQIFSVPVMCGLILTVSLYLLQHFFLMNLFAGSERVFVFIIIVMASVIYYMLFFALVNYLKYITAEDKQLLKILLQKTIPFYRNRTDDQ